MLTLIDRYETAAPDAYAPLSEGVTFEVLPDEPGYDLSRLARNALIRRVPGRNRYALTRDRLLFAHFYTKVTTTSCGR